MKVKLSKHAKVRAKQRLNISHKPDRTKQFKQALLHGVHYTKYCGDFYTYLENKKKKHSANIGIKIFNNNIYIYKGKLVITVYPVPNKYRPVDQYLTSFLKSSPLVDELYKQLDKKEVSFEVMSRDSSGVTCGLFINNEFINFGIGKNDISARNSAIKNYLDSIKKNVGEDSEE